MRWRCVCCSWRLSTSYYVRSSSESLLRTSTLSTSWFVSWCLVGVCRDSLSPSSTLILMLTLRSSTASTAWPTLKLGVRWRPTRESVSRLSRKLLRQHFSASCCAITPGKLIANRNSFPRSIVVFWQCLLPRCYNVTGKGKRACKIHKQVYMTKNDPQIGKTW